MRGLEILQKILDVENGGSVGHGNVEARQSDR